MTKHALSDAVRWSLSSVQSLCAQPLPSWLSSVQCRRRQQFENKHFRKDRKERERGLFKCAPAAELFCLRSGREGST